MFATRRVVLWWLLFAVLYTNAEAFSLFPTRRGDGSTSIFQRGRKPPKEKEPEYKDAAEGGSPHFVPFTHGAKKPATKPHKEDVSKKESTLPKTVPHVRKGSSPDVVSPEKKVTTPKPGGFDVRTSAKKAPAKPEAESAVRSPSRVVEGSTSSSVEGKSRASGVPVPALHGEEKLVTPPRHEKERLAAGVAVTEEGKPCLRTSGESTAVYKGLSTLATKGASTGDQTATPYTTADTKSAAYSDGKTAEEDCMHVSAPGQLPGQFGAEAEDTTASERGVDHHVTGDNVRFGPKPALHVKEPVEPSKGNTTHTGGAPAEDSRREDANIPSFSHLHFSGAESLTHMSSVMQKATSSPSPSVTPRRPALPAPRPVWPPEPPQSPAESPAPHPVWPTEPPQSPAESPDEKPVVPSDPPQSPAESPDETPVVPTEPPQSPAESPDETPAVPSEPPQSPAKSPDQSPAVPSEPPQSPAESPEQSPAVPSEPPQSPAKSPEQSPAVPSEPPQSPAEPPEPHPAVPSEPPQSPAEPPEPSPAVPSEPPQSPAEPPEPSPAVPSEPSETPVETLAPHLHEKAEGPAATSEDSGESSDTSKASPEPSTPAPSPSEEVEVLSVRPRTSTESSQEPETIPALTPRSSQQEVELDTEEQLVKFLQKRFQNQPGVTVGATLPGNKKVGLLVEEGAQITLEHVTIHPMPDVDVILMVAGGQLTVENVKIEAAPSQTVLRRSLREPAAEVKTGLEVANGSVVHIQNGTFEAATDTMISVRGNSFFQCTNCVFRSNKGSRGGAVLVEDSEAEFVNCQMINNEAVTGGSVHFEAGSSSSEAPTEHKSMLTIKHSAFENNRATDKGAGVFALRAENIHFSSTTFKDGTAQNGAAAWIEAAQKLEVIGSRFERNQADSSGGAVYTKDVSKLHVKDSNFDNNRAFTGLGGAVFACDAHAVMLSDSSFGSNSAAGGGALGFHEHFSEAGRLDIARSRFTNNDADDRGGALLLQRVSRNEVEPHAELEKVDNVVAAISETTFDNNVAMGSGGAIFVTSNAGEAYNLKVTLKTTSFTLNKAHEGSCLYCGEHTALVLPDSVFDENGDREGSNSVTHCHCKFNALSKQTDSSRTSSYDMKTVKQNCLLETAKPTESAKEQNNVWLFVCIAMAAGFVFCAVAALFIVKYRKRMQHERTSGIYHRSLSTFVGPARSQSILSQPFYEDFEDEDAPLAGPSGFGSLTGAESLDHDMIMQREQSETLAHAMSADQAFVDSMLWEQKPLIPPAIHRLNSISEYASEAP